LDANYFVSDFLFYPMQFKQEAHVFTLLAVRLNTGKLRQG